MSLHQCLNSCIMQPKQRTCQALWPSPADKILHYQEREGQGWATMVRSGSLLHKSLQQRRLHEEEQREWLISLQILACRAFQGGQMEASLDLAVEGEQINCYLTLAERYQFHLPGKQCLFQGKGRITFV